MNEKGGWGSNISCLSRRAATEVMIRQRALGAGKALMGHAKINERIQGSGSEEPCDGFFNCLCLAVYMPAI